MLRHNNKNKGFVGNLKTKVYHMQDCYCIKQITPSNIRDVGTDFLDKDKNSYRACGKCFKNNTLETDLDME